MNLHALLAVYVELMDHNNGPHSRQAMSFIQEHSHKKRFVRCATIAAFFWNTRH